MFQHYCIMINCYRYLALEASTLHFYVIMPLHYSHAAICVLHALYYTLVTLMICCDLDLFVNHAVIMI